MFKVIIFDLIGIFSKEKNIFTILKNILNYSGTSKSLYIYLKEEYNSLVLGEISETEFFKKLKKISKSKKKISLIKKELLEVFEPNFNKELFNKVKNSFKVALCSEFVSPWWTLLKKKYKINFDYEVLSDNVGIKKPHSKLYLFPSLFFKINPNKCAYVSDEIEDIIIAKQLGMQTIFIPGKNKKCKIADYTYKNINELLKVLS